MKLIKITKQGNFHFLLDDGRDAGIYPATKYIRISTSQANPYHGKRLMYQMREKFDTTEQMLKRLYEYNLKNCKDGLS